VRLSGAEAVVVGRRIDIAQHARVVAVHFEHGFRVTAGELIQALGGGEGQDFLREAVGEHNRVPAPAGVCRDDNAVRRVAKRRNARAYRFRGEIGRIDGADEQTVRAAWRLRGPYMAERELNGFDHFGVGARIDDDLAAVGKRFGEGTPVFGNDDHDAIEWRAQQ